MLHPYTRRADRENGRFWAVYVAAWPLGRFGRENAKNGRFGGKTAYAREKDGAAAGVEYGGEVGPSVVPVFFTF